MVCPNTLGVGQCLGFHCWVRGNVDCIWNAFDSSCVRPVLCRRCGEVKVLGAHARVNQNIYCSLCPQGPVFAAWLYEHAAACDSKERLARPFQAQGNAQISRSSRDLPRDVSIQLFIVWCGRLLWLLWSFHRRDILILHCCVERWFGRKVDNDTLSDSSLVAGFSYGQGCNPSDLWVDVRGAIFPSHWGIASYYPTCHGAYILDTRIVSVD